MNQAPHQLDLWQWMCGVPTRCFAKLAFGFKRDIAVEDEVNAIVDFGNGATGHFMTCTHDMVGTDRLEMLFDKGKVVVDNSKKVTITRLSGPEQEISENMGMEQVMQLFMGKMDTTELISTEEKVYESVFGEQHSTVMENFALNILEGSPRRARGGRHQRRAPRQRLPPVGVDRRGGRPRELRRGALPRRAEQAHRGRGHVRDPVLT